MRLAPSLTEGPPSQTPASGASVGSTRTRDQSDGGSQTGTGTTTTGPTLTSGGDEPPARPLKFLPPIEEPDNLISTHFPWWPVGIALVSIVTVIALISILTGGDEPDLVSLPPTVAVDSSASPDLVSPPPDDPPTEPEEAISTPAVPIRVVPPEYAGLDVILEDAGFSDDEIDFILDLMLEDLMFDIFFSDSSELAENYGADVDIWDVLLARFLADEDLVDLLFNNSVFECGETTDDMTTVCSQHGVLDMPAGEIVMVVQTLSGPVASENWVYSYSAVVDSDGDPANNWVPQGSFDWDFFQGTDTWYVLDYNAGTWTGGAFAGDFANPIPSAFRAVIRDNTIVWFLSGAEMPGITGAQTTAFRHDGSFAPAMSAADVYGANPTEPLIPLVDLDADPLP